MSLISVCLQMLALLEKYARLICISFMLKVYYDWLTEHELKVKEYVSKYKCMGLGRKWFSTLNSCNASSSEKPCLPHQDLEGCLSGLFSSLSVVFPLKKISDAEVLLIMHLSCSNGIIHLIGTLLYDILHVNTLLFYISQRATCSKRWRGTRNATMERLRTMWQ